MYQFLCLFMLFFICSFVGWLIEVIGCSIYDRKLVNRGFLIGPYLPIWGLGAVLISVVCHSYTYDTGLLILVIAFLASVLEYVTSYGLEKIFHARWWDYSDKFLNLDGRICLVNSAFFGVVGVFYLKYLEPQIISFITSIPHDLFYVISSPLFAFFILDIIVSFKLIFCLRNTFTSLRKDYTREISSKIRKKLSEQSKLLDRILKAFPHAKLIGNRKKRRFFFKNR